MNFSKHLFLFFILLPIILQAQQNNFGRTYSNSLPDEFKLDVESIREHVFEGIPEGYKQGSLRGLSFQFSDVVAMQAKDLVGGGSVYSDWQEFEDYLNEIFRKVIPKELQDDEMIHAYLIKEGQYNAFMTPTGMTFFNVGLFGYMNNEAMIAGVLAHELAHYHMQHSLQRFIKAQRGQLTQGGLFKYRSFSNFSINNESQADSLAMVWMLESGYHLKGLEQAFKVMDGLSKNALLKSEKRWELKATSHPLSKDRLASIQAFIGKHRAAPGAFFLVDEEKFKRLMKEVKPEILKHLLNNFSYDLCIENAFKFHIYDVENPIYIYYLLEGIRRKCYLDTDQWGKKFITDRYYRIIDGNDPLKRRKVKMEDHLFKKIPVEILCIDPTTLRNVEARFYWKEVKFTTYEQAFEFFYKISEVYKDPEAILSYALSITHSEEERNKHLSKYLEKENIRYKEYAQSLKDGQIRHNLKKEKLTILSGLNTVIRQKSNDIVIREGIGGENNQLMKLYTKSVEGFKDRTPVFIDDFKASKLNDHNLLKELEGFSFQRTISKGMKTELHILDPRYWQIMKDYEVNEIEFVSGSYAEINSNATKISDYKEIIQRDFESVLSTEKSLKYFELYVTSVREVKDGVMKIRVYGGNNKLKYKEKGYDQVLEYIKSLLVGKDQEAIALDRKYKSDKP